MQYFDPTFGGACFHNPSKKCNNCGCKCPDDRFCSRECLREYVVKKFKHLDHPKGKKYD